MSGRELCQCGRPMLTKAGEYEPTCAECALKPDYCTCDAIRGSAPSFDAAGGQKGHAIVPPTLSFVPGEEIGGQEGQLNVPEDSCSDLGVQASGTSGTGFTAGAPERTSWTAAELRDLKFPEPRWAVPGIIPEGVTLLGGAPKIGKSWLALGLSLAIASGGKALGSVEVEPGAVLYLALEDTGRRLQ